MSLFDDVSRFLETQLEEYLRNNPHLELQILLEQLQEQERDTTQLITALQNEQKRLEMEILLIAQEIQTWHGRVSKATAAGRTDLAQAAKEREAALLRQGNQLWGRMEGIKQRLTQAQELLRQIQQRKKEVQTKANSQGQTIGDTNAWNQNTYSQTERKSPDPLEKEFHDWDLEEELKRLKRDLGK